ncbi:MAG TPA: sodium:calcium antiporter, partial [Bacillota bacterium]|nr:sodium:calcium antiporter [Bacillota bacterium]
MEIFLTIILFILGLVLIVKGGDWFVDAACWIAEVTGIPQFVVGATIVSIATTLPELIVSIVAAADGKNDMAIGNAIGSVTANSALIMGIALTCIPSVIRRRDYMIKGLLLCVSVAVVTAFSFGGSFGLTGTIILMLLFAVFITDNLISGKKGRELLDVSLEDSPLAAKIVKEETTVAKDAKTVVINILKFAAGAAGIVVGADLLVDNGSKLAALLGVPESLIAVTFVAIGTSLPELVTTITAIIKKQASLSAGNIIGANTID